jgi:DNA (cytosine-5)-methyltransferase 1
MGTGRAGYGKIARPKNGPRVLDLFSGAGGIALGFADAGYRIVGGIDNFQQAIDSFEANVPNANGMVRDLRVRGFQDVREFVGSGGVDVIVGGPSALTQTEDTGI